MGMSRLKIYRWGVMLLLISNLLILSWALFHHFRIERPPLHKNPLQLLGGLNLNEEVFQMIQSLGGEHHQQMNELNKREQDYIYKSLLTENEQELDLYIDEISKIESAKIEITRQHFRDVEELLDSVQLIRFQFIKHEMVTALFQKRKPNNRPIPQ
jgi:hypothetical protein